MASKKQGKIKIIKGGPYIVTGGIPLVEKLIVPEGSHNEYRTSHEYPLQEEYALCRCGHSKHMPFCDGCHEESGFVGNETASRMQFADRAERLEGPELTLLDDGRCAFARFCHRDEGKVWDLIRKSADPDIKESAIRGAQECPAGRLVVLDKDGQEIEPVLDQSIEVLKDVEKDVCGPLFVKGKIELESSDGSLYESRNRMALCRCGKSIRKPFCDATHISIQFKENNQ